ncbi:MAG: hypothetical protein IPN71_23565 [Fibrobacteres bacterium]|nr:hypothetical protein [Fibrobacterota bacterium]
MGIVLVVAGGRFDWVSAAWVSEFMAVSDPTSDGVPLMVEEAAFPASGCNRTEKKRVMIENGFRNGIVHLFDRK